MKQTLLTRRWPWLAALLVWVLSLVPRSGQAQLYYSVSDNTPTTTLDELRSSPLATAGETTLTNNYTFASGPIAVDVAGRRIFVSDTRNNFAKIVAINMDPPYDVTTFLTPASIPNSVNTQLTGIAIGGTDLYYSLSDNAPASALDQLRRIPLAGGSETTLANGHVNVAGPLVVDVANQRVLIADTRNNLSKIVAVSTNSPYNTSTFLNIGTINGGTGTVLTGIAIGGTDLYYSVSDNGPTTSLDELRRSPLASPAETTIKTGHVSVAGPLVVDVPNQRVLIADTRNNLSKIVAVSTNSPYNSGTFLTPNPINGSASAVLSGIGIFPLSAPTVTTATPASVTGTSAALGGNVTADGGSSVTERGVVYSSANNAPTTNDTKDTNGTGTGTFSETISGLTPGTTYYVRAYAINSTGTSYGSVQTFTTAALPTVVSVTRLTPSPTATATANYRVVFSGSVSGLSTSNFSLTTTGLSGASIASVSGSGTTYTVVVNTGTGNGTLRLDVQNATGVTPTISNVPYTSGEQYTITKSFAAAPKLRIQAAGSASNNGDVTAFVDLVQVLNASNGSAVVNGLQNGSFETNNVDANGFKKTADGVVAAPWAFTGLSGISRNGSAFGSTAADGDAVALIQSAGDNNASIAQNLAVPTGSYQISFRAIQRNYTSKDQRLNVFVNDVFVGNIQPNNSTPPTYDTFTSATFSVTAPALTATVSTTSASPTSTAPIPFSVSFSQSVGTSFMASDVTVVGGTLTSGTFSGSGAGPYTFTVTPNGTGTVSVSLAANVAIDANNTGNTASNTVSVQYNQPVTPAPVVTTPANGSFVNTTTPAYSGTAPANATVTVYVDGSPLSGTVTASASGNWSKTQPSALSQGSHTVYATAQLSGSAVSASSNTNTFTVDTVPPAVPVVQTPANGSTTPNNTPVYTGSAQASSTVTVFVDGSAIGQTAADAAGNWTLNQPTALSEGSHTVYATATDAAGNTSPNSATNTFTIVSLATYTSSTADHSTTGIVLAGSTNQAILRVAIVIGGGSANPLSAQSFTFTTTGSTSPADIAAARVYYTGTSSTLATTTQFGSAVTAPTGSFTVTGSQQLSAGTNYFFLVYDVAATATPGNLLDATVPSLTVGGVARTPSVTAPAGSRRILRADGVAGTALRFTGDATPGYLNFSSSTIQGPLLGQQYTQAVWIKPAVGTSSSTFYVLGNGTGTAAAPYIYVTGNGRVGAGFGATSQQAETNPNTITSNEWHHVVATYNGSILRLYLDGVQVATDNTTGTVPSTRVNFIGNVAATNSGNFPGDIDEVSQWTTVLDQVAIRQLRHLTLSGTETGLVSYLQFNDAGGTSVDGISGAVGTLTGASRVTSTAPVGAGISNLQTVTASTTYNFTGTNVSIAFAGVSGSSETVVSRLEGRALGTQPSATGLQRTYTQYYWIVDKYPTGTFTAANVTYTLGATDISAADAATPSTLKLFKRGSNSDGAFDTPISATAANASAGTVTFPVTSFSQTVIGTFGTSPLPLPVELVRFTAERRGQDALLQWATAQERNNAYFEVESSVDGRTFRAIGRVTGQGTSVLPKEYKLTDVNLTRYGRPVVYYRLRQVDMDGTATLSAVQTVQVPKVASDLTATVFPNPATDQLTIRLSSSYTGAAQGWLFDAQGRKVQDISRQLTTAAGADVNLTVEHLPNGVYTLRLVLSGQVIHQQLVVQH